MLQEQDRWLTKRTIAMNLETPQEVDTFISLANARVSEKHPIAGLTIAANTSLIDATNYWTENLIENHNTMQIWLMSRQNFDPLNRLEDLNPVSNLEKLGRAIQTAQEGIDKYAVMGIDTGRRSLPDALKDMTEMAKELVYADPGEITVQMSCHNLLVAVEDPSGEIQSVYGDELNITLYIGLTGTPDINRLMQRVDYYADIHLKELCGVSPDTVMDLPVDKTEGVQFSQN